AAHQLHVEMALAEDAARRLADRRKGVDEDVVEGLASLEAGLQRLRLAAQRFVRQGGELRLRGVDLVDQRLQAFDEAIVCRAEKSPGDGADHRNLEVACGSGRHSYRRNAATG